MPHHFRGDLMAAALIKAQVLRKHAAVRHVTPPGGLFHSRARQARTCATKVPATALAPYAAPFPPPVPCAAVHTFAFRCGRGPRAYALPKSAGVQRTNERICSLVPSCGYQCQSPCKIKFLCWPSRGPLSPAIVVYDCLCQSHQLHRISVV